MFKNIGETIITYHRGIDPIEDVSGKTHDVYNAFVVGSNSNESNHTTARQWGTVTNNIYFNTLVTTQHGKDSDTPFALSNDFVRAFITKTISHRQSQKVMKIVLQHKNGIKILLDMTVEHLVEYILPNFTVSSGMFEGDMVITMPKNGQKVVAIPKELYKNNVLPDTQISVPISKLTIGTLYRTRTKELVYVGRHNKNHTYFDIKKAYNRSSIRIYKSVILNDTKYKITDIVEFSNDLVNHINTMDSINCTMGIYGESACFYIRNIEPYNYDVHITNAGIKCDSIEDNYMSLDEIESILKVQNSIDFDTSSGYTQQSTVMVLTDSQISKDVETLIKKHGVKL